MEKKRKIFAPTAPHFKLIGFPFLHHRLLYNQTATAEPVYYIDEGNFKKKNEDDDENSFSSFAPLISAG